jgi:predicted acylesterase/phospholipase RssA
VEASSTPTICRLSDSCRHQLSAITRTTIEGKHYWDGGLVSNSPLDQVIEVTGLTDKTVYIVNLWLDQRTLPQSIPEVLARRDEIFFAEKIRRNIRTRAYIDDYRQLVEEIYRQPRTQNSRANQTTAALH